MGSASLNPLILAEKLSKLNSSQQSIESLSHWCIFHMNKAKLVVETWARQFHCAPREQRLAFLYLANDILQNSRRKGAEFVAEFWKVLPNALHDVIESGDELGKKSVFRLINIWDERKVFGSRGQMLKEEFVKRQSDNNNKNNNNNNNNNNNSKLAGYKLRSPGGNGNSLDKLVSGYQAVYGSQFDEDAIFNKCRNAISVIEKVDKGVEGDYSLGRANSGISEELKGQNAILRDCIEQLAAIESSRAKLVSMLRETLEDQVHKLDQVRDQLQAAQTHSERADTIFRQLHNVNDNGHVIAEQNNNPIPMPQNFISGSSEQSSSVVYTPQVQPFSEKPKDPKSAAAAVAAQLAASSSSAQMLTYVLSSLASEGVIGNNNNNNNNNNIHIEDLSDKYPSEKRAKIKNDEKPPPPSSPPPEPPLPPPMQLYPVPQYMQTAMPIMYGYNVDPQQPIPHPGYVPVGPPPVVSVYAPPENAYQEYTPESGFYGQPQSLPMTPMSRQ